MVEFMAIDLDMFLRIVVAMILGGVLGFERELAGKTAGLRTYSLISVGAALFVIISQIVTEEFLGKTVFDPLRVASQIVVGIGFIGTGLIIFQENKVRGLTTAAGLWVTTAIGMATGFGLYSVAVFTTIVVLFIFVVLWFVEKWFMRKPLKKKIGKN